jgi:RNA recognition motif-containing protein
MNIYVGNLAYEVTDEDLNQLFIDFGQVESVKVIKDNFSGRSKGFGFVEMPDPAEAESAIEGLDGKELKGRTLKVNKAKPRNEGARYGRGNRGGGGRRGAGRRF